MTKIIVDPEDLDNQSRRLDSVASQLSGIAHDVESIGSMASEHNGQFGPYVRSMASSGAGSVHGASGSAGDYAFRLRSIALRFAEVDGQGAASLAAGGGLLPASSASAAVSSTPASEVWSYQSLAGVVAGGTAATTSSWYINNKNQLTVVHGTLDFLSGFDDYPYESFKIGGRILNKLTGSTGWVGRAYGFGKLGKFGKNYRYDTATLSNTALGVGLAGIGAGLEMMEEQFEPLDSPTEKRPTLEHTIVSETAEAALNYGARCIVRRVAYAVPVVGTAMLVYDMGIFAIRMAAVGLSAAGYPEVAETFNDVADCVDVISWATDAAGDWIADQVTK